MIQLMKLNNFLVLLNNMPELFNDVLEHYEEEEDYESCAIAMQAKSMLDSVKEPLNCKVSA